MFHISCLKDSPLAYLQYYCHIVSVLNSVVDVVFLLSVWTPESWIGCVDDTTFELILKFHWNRTGTNTQNEAYKDNLSLAFKPPKPFLITEVTVWAKPVPTDSKQVLFLWSAHVCLFSAPWTFQVRCGLCPNPFFILFFSDVAQYSTLLTTSCWDV